MTAEDPALPRLRDALPPDISLKIGAVEHCDLRLVGPAELAEKGIRGLRRHRLRADSPPLLVLVQDQTSPELIRECFRAGARDVLMLAEVRRWLSPVVRRVLAQSSAGLSFERETDQLAAELGKRARQVEATLQRLQQSYDQTLEALVSALDLREQETANHSLRVALYALRLALRLRVPEHALRDLYHGALLHDIGKIGIPDGVLLKPGRLTEEEWNVMRTHPDLGAEMLKGISFLTSASDVPLCHHEAWNGSGYPRGLCGSAIPLHARIFAVVDTYDALRSQRSYKPALSHAESMAQLRAAAGVRLDPEIVENFAGEAPGTWERLAASNPDGFEAVLAAARATAE